MQHAAGSSRHDRRRDPALRRRQRREARRRQGRRRPDRGRAARARATRRGSTSTPRASAIPRAGDAAVRSDYKLMAVFTRITDESGDDVVRCFVKGAAPAVMSHAATALSAATEHPLGRRPAQRARRQRPADGRGRAARDGRRLPRPRRGVVRPARRSAGLRRRAWRSRASWGWSTRRAHESKHCGATTPRRRTSACAWSPATTWSPAPRSRKQLGIEGEAILGAEFAALDEEERLARIDGIGVVGRVAPEHKVLLVDTLKQKGDVVAMTGRRRQRRAVDQGRPHRHRDGQRHRGREERRPDDPHRRQLRHDRARGRAGPQALRQPDQVRPLRADLARRVRARRSSARPLLNIAAGQPFTPPQVLWIHFFISAPFGVALGLDQADTGPDAAAPAAEATSRS